MGLDIIAALLGIISLLGGLHEIRDGDLKLPPISHRIQEVENIRDFRHPVNHIHDHYNRNRPIEKYIIRKHIKNNQNTLL